MSEAGARGAAGRQPHRPPPVSSSAPPAPPVRGVVVELLPEQLVLVTAVGMLRRAIDMGAGRRDAYGLKPENGPLGDIRACGGELCVSIVAGVPWTGMLGRLEIPDLDVGALEVRTTRHPYGKLQVYEHDPDETPCVLVTGDPPRMTVVGWKRAGDAKREGKRQVSSNGTVYYYVPQSALEPFTRATLRKLARWT